MKKLYLLLGFLLSIVFVIPSVSYGLAVFQVVQGGTGTSTPSGILYGDNGATSHLNTVTIGSNLTFVGGTLSATGGGGNSFGYPFTNPTEFATVTAATTTPLWAQEGIYASSTSVISTNVFQSNSLVGIATTTAEVGLDIQATGALARQVRINSAGNEGLEMYDSSGHFNWLLGAQNNLNNGFEITPSTAAGNETFSTPVFDVTSSGTSSIKTALKVGDALAGTFSTWNPHLLVVQLDQNVGDPTVVGEFIHTISGTAIAGEGSSISFGMTGNSGAIRQGAGVGGVMEGSASTVTGGLAFYTNTTDTNTLNEIARFSNAGNLGIATNTPTSALSVQGNELLSGNLQVANITATGTIAANTLTLTNPLAIAYGGTNAASFTTSGNGVYYNGTSLLTAPLTSAVTYPYATTTAISAANELNLPHGTTVSSLTAGDIFINTNSVASSSVAFSAASQTNTLFAVHSMGITLASSSLAYIGAYGASASTSIVIANPIHSSTLISYYCKTDVGTVYVGFGNGTTATTTETQCTTSGTNVPLSTNNTFTGRQAVYLEVGHEGSNPNIITVTADVEDSN